MRAVARGLLAGAAASEALNIVTYLDMTLRGRPPSSTPEETAKRFAAAAGVSLGEGKTAENRAAGLGPLLGYTAGLGTSVVYALLVRRRISWKVATVLLSAMAMLAANGPMTLLGVTDPREWSASD